MKKDIRSVALPVLILLIFLGLNAEVKKFENNWSKNPLFTVTSRSHSGIQITFSMHKMVIKEKTVNGKKMKVFGVPGIFLQDDEGSPNLSGTGRYIAIPQGATARVKLLDSRKEVYKDIEIAPAPNIPLDNDDNPLRYTKNMDIYNKNAYYPESPVRISESMKIRGIQVAILGVTPFQYNPVTKKLIVYKDMKLSVEFIGGNGRFSDDRLRSRFWEPILQNHLLNYESLPKVNFYSKKRLNSRKGFEYIIIVPNDPIFEAWGDTLKAWRKLQGISTEVFTLSEVGGSSASNIESFINDAYKNWDPAPAAFLLLSDYPSTGRGYGITSPSWDSYCVSDNIYADVDEDHLPDIHHARITAQTEDQLRIMINKVLKYERNPQTDAAFYDQPLVAAAWQNGRWFMLLGEIVAGFFETKLDKHPLRQYNLYSDEDIPSVGCEWSDHFNTAAVVEYFSNLGYIPKTNQHDQKFWNNGSTEGVIDIINSGTFLIQHRDHGGLNGWGEPAFHVWDMEGLSNDKFPFVFSTNCLTGKYDNKAETFTEKLHRIEGGALGVSAASEVSFSYVNDTYLWGSYDCLWPEFLPDYPAADIPGKGDLRPCMAMTAGKFYLEASNWPRTQDTKKSTYHLFHHHGDAFFTFYSEEPKELSIIHNAAHLVNSSTFTVTADEGSIISLTSQGEIVGVAEGNGSAIEIPLLQEITPDNGLFVTVTKPNHFRYEKEIPVIIANSPYISIALKVVKDANNNGQVNAGEKLDIGVWAKNFGKGTAKSVYGILSTTDPYISKIKVDSSWFGDIQENDSAFSKPNYRFTISDSCPNNYKVTFQVTFNDGDSTWVSNNFVTVYTPIMEFVDVKVEGGNGNGAIEPGEKVDLIVNIINGGEAKGNSVYAKLVRGDNFIKLNSDSSFYGSMKPDEKVSNSSNPFNITAHKLTPEGHKAKIRMVIKDQRPNVDFVSDTFTFVLPIGTPPPPFVIYEDDFEYSSADSFSILWNTSGNWNNSTKEAHSPTHAAYSGEVAEGIVHLTMKNPIDLSSYTKVDLTFWNKHAIDGLFWAKANFQVSRNGGSEWTDLWSATTETSPWTKNKTILTSPTKDMLLRFQVEAKPSFTKFCDWFIDDLKVTIPFDNEPPYFANTTIWKDVPHTGPFPIQSTITDANDVEEKVILYYRVSKGKWKKLDMKIQDKDLYEATIPKQSGTKRIDYYLEATDKWFASTANKGTDPVGANEKDGFYSFIFGSTGILKNPNMVHMNLNSIYNNGNLNIQFYLPTQMKVNISVFNLLGQEIANIINKNVKKGSHLISWNKKESKTRAASGFYLLVFEANAPNKSKIYKSFKRTDKILLLK